MGEYSHDDGSGTLLTFGCVTIGGLSGVAALVLAICLILTGCSTVPNYPKTVEDDGYLVECGKPYTREEDRRGIEHDCTDYGPNSISAGYAIYSMFDRANAKTASVRPVAQSPSSKGLMDG